MATPSESTDAQLALKAYFLALMSIDRKKQGKPPDPYIEAEFPPLVEEINKRFSA